MGGPSEPEYGFRLIVRERLATHLAWLLASVCTGSPLPLLIRKDASGRSPRHPHHEIGCPRQLMAERLDSDDLVRPGHLLSHSSSVPTRDISSQTAQPQCRPGEIFVPVLLVPASRDLPVGGMDALHAPAVRRVVLDVGKRLMLPTSSMMVMARMSRCPASS